MERVGVVDPVEHRQVDLGEFEAEEAAAGLQDPVGLGERLVDPGTFRMPKAMV